MYTKEVEVGGKILSFETGRFARQASGSVMVRYGDTMVLVAAVASPKAMEGIDFFPLQVEYREKFAAVGKFPGGFFKREGKPSEKEVLTARLIDRPIRPLFDDNYRNETQVIANTHSFDKENDPDVIAICGASAALSISEIPFLGPIAGVRVGRVDGQFVANPTFDQLAASDIELVVAGTEDSIMMVEGEAHEVSEEVMLEALAFAQEQIAKIVIAIKEFASECGKPKMAVTPKEVDQELFAEVKALAYDRLDAIISTVMEKQERSNAFDAVTKETNEALAEKYPEMENTIKGFIHDFQYELIRKCILEKNLRLDGRKTHEIRNITIDLGVLPRTHASALFTRGETQSLTTLTLGSKNDQQTIDGLMEESVKRFNLHYNFPPFSVGEVGRYSGVGRREVGHGNLAERSLKNMLPAEKDFPYAIRLVSDILESNGSSSMATVCAGSLALMDGGVPVKKAIAGIAMGLIKEGDAFAVLSDILGNEDHFGDMDFKVAGSAEGITGFQMDIKIKGVSFEIMEIALRQAKEGRLHILGIMNKAIQAPREEICSFAPTLVSLTVPTDLIGSIIGPGGKTIQGMQKEFGVDISIEDDGTVQIAGPDGESANSAATRIRLMTTQPVVGEVYDGVVTKLMEFGALVEILPGKSGLMHISEIDMKKVHKVTDYFKEGDKVKVKLLRIEGGKYSLSRKALLKEAAAAAEATKKEE